MVNLKLKVKLVLRCPNCGSGNVLTNEGERVCRKCGYKDVNKQTFEVK